MSDSTPDEPQDANERQVNVDEDWKNQVQAEKDAFKQLDSDKDDSSGAEAQPFPEASFPMLVTTLATQATIALGQTVAPDSEKAHVDLNLAKHLVDTLGIIEEKTQGNLTEEESGMLTSVLHQLRMLFVAAQGQASSQPEKKSSIELP